MTIDEEIENLIEDKLNAKERNNLSDKNFGLPKLRKFPLNDREHVIKAIQMFHNCPEEHRKELAKNIQKAAIKFNIVINKKSLIYKYL